MKKYKMTELSRDRRAALPVLSGGGSRYIDHHVFMADFTRIEDIRAMFSKKNMKPPSYSAFMLYAISRVLNSHKKFNSYLREFPTLKLAVYEGIDISLTGASVFSVIRNSDGKKFMDIINHLGALKTIKHDETPEYKIQEFFKIFPNFMRMALFGLLYKPFPDRMRKICGTCAFTSVGKYGADFAAPLSSGSITFSLGRVAERPMAVDKKTEPRSSAYITLTYDHRIADGADCSELGAGLKNFIENYDGMAIFND
ncbi:MAG TPA: 2-oxo acid dehydrogenase subunit E2 [Candidatus Wallbacteria bacterium]|nr:2-oxo acid dehydrogenase subunit E2 [Candidatus Wallbacteria bacterium]